MQTYAERMKKIQGLVRAAITEWEDMADSGFLMEDGTEGQWDGHDLSYTEEDEPSVPWVESCHTTLQLSTGVDELSDGDRCFWTISYEERSVTRPEARGRSTYGYYDHLREVIDCNRHLVEKNQLPHFDWYCEKLLSAFKEYEHGGACSPEEAFNLNIRKLHDIYMDCILWAVGCEKAYEVLDEREV